METRVKVEFIGVFREMTGTTGLILRMEGQATLRQVVRKLADEFGKDLEDRILQGDSMTEDVLVILNGRSIRAPDANAVTIDDGDSLVFAPESAP